MDILEYINELIEQGYSEEDAERCANAMFSEDFSEEDEQFMRFKIAYESGEEIEEESLEELIDDIKDFVTGAELYNKEVVVVRVDSPY